ncbi:hypothetical protein GCM10010201_22100 [Pilimelia columellifera subsp. columellifera]|uniref:Uncharacterized protein n=1 Tax=Pilimelia columellifera subsp. columellifera TaxID=706583 RepID=A0ABP6AU70_9ACTN
MPSARIVPANGRPVPSTTVTELTDPPATFVVTSALIGTPWAFVTGVTANVNGTVGAALVAASPATDDVPPRSHPAPASTTAKASPVVVQRPSYVIPRAFPRSPLNPTYPQVTAHR